MNRGFDVLDDVRATLLLFGLVLVMLPNILVLHLAVLVANGGHIVIGHHRRHFTKINFILEKKIIIKNVLVPETDNRFFFFFGGLFKNQLAQPFRNRRKSIAAGLWISTKSHRRVKMHRNWKKAKGLELLRLSQSNPISPQ
jgi:hypothetical protein